ncbi:MAG TPA: glutamine synthetase family protein [Usitatibacter sp.]|nr:glutamine synthetase family protein [Usitatibacter sp.]
MTRREEIPGDRETVLQSVRTSGSGKVKVAVADIDGILRGKYVHVDKFFSAVDGGIGFSVFGTDLNDRPYDDGYASGRRLGFPDATVELDLKTFRRVPWDGNVPFFLGNFVKNDGSPHPLCPRQVLKRVLARANKMGFGVLAGAEYEFVNFRETPETWAQKKGTRPTPITHGMIGYSLVEANLHREYISALMDETARFGVPIESLHTETGPGVYEAAMLFGDALEAADRAILFKDAAKEIASRFGIMPSFMAKWHPKYPGSAGHIHQSLSDGSRNLFHDPDGAHGGMSKLFESYLAGQLRYLFELAPMFWPTINSYKRLVDGFWAPVKATWGVDNRTAAFRVLTGSPKATRIETRCPGADSNAYLAMAACVAAGLAGIEENLALATPPIRGDNEGAEDAVRAPRTLIETTRVFHASRLAREWFGDAFVAYFAATREQEWREWLDAVTDWELRRYFDVI